jgi:hypothetical protein
MPKEEHVMHRLHTVATAIGILVLAAGLAPPLKAEDASPAPLPTGVAD